MTGLQDYVGQVLDEKYRLERLLGRGGMGAVYLATHLGTERYVALKLITPQFMRNEEFVERFKREARAAGRLRHPNVVDVTDFGFARANAESVAYLVMEYLDGCTLADVLKEEQRLPLDWVVDILEQVCSAVHEAHQQGIVHRDLKPENIWLEPNRLGGYRVKVLDFGIAKLAEVTERAGSPTLRDTVQNPKPTVQGRVNDGRAGDSNPLGAQLGVVDSRSSSEKIQPDLEGDTLIFSESPRERASREFKAAGTTEAVQTSEEANTQLFAPSVYGADAVAAGARPRATQPGDEGERTLMLDQSTRQAAGRSETTMPAAISHGTELTQVGAIMGTPLYMSPEQCSGKPLDARSDIYSLGVITYQMLAGEPPFSGNTGDVMREHIEAMPPGLREKTRKVPKRLSSLVMTALAKDPAARPQTALAFSNSLHAQAEGIGALYRRAFALYSEYFPKFFKMSLIAHIPLIVTMSALISLQLAIASQPKGLSAAKIAIICGLIISGLLQVVAYFVAASAISGMTAVIVTQLSAAPLRPVELRTAFTVLKQRWKPFLKTSVRVTLRIFIGLVLFVIPGIVMNIRYALYAPVVLVEGLEKQAALRRARELASRSWRTMILVWLLQFLIPLTVSFLFGQVKIGVNHQSPGPTRHIGMQEIYQQLSGLVNIVVVPLASIVSALLYLKMRQLGGETLSAALAQIEEVDTKHSQWRQRMRTRLSLSTPRSTTNTPRSR